MNSFRIIFSDYFSFDELKHVLIYLGKMYEVEVRETVHKNRHGYTYIIHMESWTKAGEYFRTALLDRPHRYWYDDSERHLLCFMCEGLS